MKSFSIDIEYVTTVTIRTEHKAKQRADETSEDFLVRKLRENPVSVFSVKQEDHPEFAKLREQLAIEGYINIRRGCWNGDTVLSPFTLNGVTFFTGSRFLSAGAINYDLKHGKASL